MSAHSITTQPDGQDQKKRAHVHGMWAAVARHWGEHADYVDDRSAAVTGRLLDAAGIGVGERVLELAGGAGGVGLAAAERVGPGGEVVISDVVPAMTAFAAERAERRHITNVSTRVLDLEAIDSADAQYDVAVSREGLMFAVDPARALAEIERVLYPGGRVAVEVWAARERNPWLGIVLDAVELELGREMPPPGMPGPFALADAEHLAGLFGAAGFADVVVEEHPVPLRTASFDEWWERTSALAGPLAKVLESLPAAAVEAIRERLRTKAAPYMTADGLEFPGVTLIASARKR